MSSLVTSCRPGREKKATPLFVRLPPIRVHGPCRFIFTEKAGKLGYVVDEIASCVSLYDLDPSTGSLFLRHADTRPVLELLYEVITVAPTFIYLPMNGFSTSRTGATTALLYSMSIDIRDALTLWFCQNDFDWRGRASTKLCHHRLGAACQSSPISAATISSSLNVTPRLVRCAFDTASIDSRNADVRQNCFRQMKHRSRS